MDSRNEEVIKAYITSIGERTVGLCVWMLEKNGFEVVLLEDPNTSLAYKLKQIYEQADDEFVRVDADVIPNRNLTPQLMRSSAPSEKWWIQFETFDWYKQDTAWGGVQYIKKKAIPYLKQSVDEFILIDRPETQLSRIRDFYQPRRFDSCPMIVGLTNYKQDMKRVMKVKANRGQSHNYDFELAQRLEEL